MGMETGDEVLMRLEDGEVRITSRSRAIRRAQELVHRHFGEGRRLSDELIAQRRAEAARG